MISEKDYNEIYLQGYEDGKNDKNNLEIHYEIKPSFTTRKIKELQQKNKRLKERIEYLERSNNRREDTILEQRQEISDLEDNWNKLREYIMNDINSRNGSKVVEIEDCRKVSETIFPTYVLIEDKSKTMREVLNKMQKLEGSDSNGQ